MNCCVECFHDKQLQTMISANGVIGNCDFCGSKNVRICSVDTQSDISDFRSDKCLRRIRYWRTFISGFIKRLGNI